MANSAITRVAAAALAAACCAFVGGCGKDEAPKEEAAATPEAYKRIRDAEYIEALEKQRGEQKDITRRIVALQAELAALGAETNTPKAAEIMESLQAEKERMLKNRIKSQALVRDRINREHESAKAIEEASKQKGN